MNSGSHFGWAAAISSFLLFPFMVLEFVNGGTFSESIRSFPIPLYAQLWLLAFAFVSILSRRVRGESARVGLVPTLAPGVIFALVTASLPDFGPVFERFANDLKR